MFNELSVKIANKNYKAFFKGGFYNHSLTTSSIHKHNYSEIHIISRGNATYNIENEIYSLTSGDMLIIPRDVFHCCIKKTPETRLSAFQINYNVNEISTVSIDSNIFDIYHKEIEKSIISQDYTTVSAYISLFCSYFYSDNKLSVQPITDYAFLIYEFFSSNYSKDLQLRDLAKILYLSDRQTERLVIKYTGKTFKNELTTIRMNIAKKLLESSNMSLGEIAQYIGYHSYSGFYKAMKKHKLF